MTLAARIDEHIADKLKGMASDLCRDIDYILDQGGTADNILGIVERVLFQMGKPK